MVNEIVSLVTSHRSQWPSSKKSTNNKCWRECGKKGTLLHYWWECKLVQSLWGLTWRFLKELNSELPYDPAIPFLGISQFSSVAQSNLTLCDPMDCNTPGFPVHPGACSNSCPSSQWCYPIISSFVVPFSSCLQSFPALGSFPVCQFFASGG